MSRPENPARRGWRADFWNACIRKAHSKKSTATSMSRIYRVDFDYISTLGMQLSQGRDFSREFSTDSAGVILNETAVRAMGWEKNPLGRELVEQTDDDATPDNI